MRKKTEKLRRLINKLALRYGDDDVDVLRLRAELDALAATRDNHLERRASPEPRNDFRSATRRLYHDTTAGDLH